MGQAWWPAWPKGLGRTLNAILCNAPVNVMPQGSHVCGVCAHADPGEFDIFRYTKVKFPNPRACNKYEIPNLALLFFCLHVKFPFLGAPSKVKILTQVTAFFANFPRVAGFLEEN